MRIASNPAPINDTIVENAQAQRLPSFRLNKSRLSRGKLPWHTANEAGAYIQALGSDCDALLRMLWHRPGARTTYNSMMIRHGSSKVLSALLILPSSRTL
jgi:hypothetical protein